MDMCAALPSLQFGHVYFHRIRSSVEILEPHITGRSNHPLHYLMIIDSAVKQPFLSPYITSSGAHLPSEDPNFPSQQPPKTFGVPAFRSEGSIGKILDETCRWVPSDRPNPSACAVGMHQDVRGIYIYIRAQAVVRGGSDLRLCAVK